MALTHDGWRAIAERIIHDDSRDNGQVHAFNYGASGACAALGVGDGQTAQTTQTDLVGPNKLKKPMKTEDYPAISGTYSNTITFQSQFDAGEANFYWYENGIFNHTAPVTGQMLTREILTLLTPKTSAFAVTFTKTLTIQS